MSTYPNLYYLQYFVDAVELGSVTASAKRNWVSHSAVSRAISALESQLGLNLLDHRKKSFNVTDVGLRMAEQARHLLSTATQFQSSELEIKDDFRGIITLGLSRALSNDWLPPLLKELKSKFPLLRVQVKFGITSELTEAIAKGVFDLALTVGTQNLPTVQSKVVTKGRFVLFEASSQKNKREPIEKKSFVLTEPRFETELLKKRYSEQFDSELSVACEVSSWTGILNLVKNDIGVGLAPDFVVHPIKRSQLHILKPHWFDCDYSVYIHFLKASRNKKSISHAIDYLQTFASGLNTS